MTLTIELPDALIQQLSERQIPEENLKPVVLAALEMWLAQSSASKGGHFNESAVPFARQLIAENRELFDALAQR
jgi:hypothetical protein